MQVKTVKLKKATALIAFMAWSISSFAQVTTMYVMKNGEAVFHSPVLSIDNVIFDEAAPGEALIVQQSDYGSPVGKILLSNIQQLSFSDGNLSVETSNGNEAYAFDDIAMLLFDISAAGINNPPARSGDMLISITPAGDVIIESLVAIKSLALFSADGKMISMQQCYDAKTQCIASLPDNAAGVYLIRVETEQGTVIKKVVKPLNK